MSDSIINIRLLFWHFKVQQETHKVSFVYNPYHWKHKCKSILIPIQVYEWSL